MQKHKAWVVQQLDTGLLKDIASLYLHQAPAMVYLNSKKFQLNTILNMHEWHFYNKILLKRQNLNYYLDNISMSLSLKHKNITQILITN